MDSHDGWLDEGDATDARDVPAPPPVELPTAPRRIKRS